MQTKRAKGDFPSPSSFQDSSARALFSEQLMLLDNLMFFTEGISPLGLPLGALLPTAVASVFFWLLH